MTYQVLARKWRPKTFAELAGQGFGQVGLDARVSRRVRIRAGTEFDPDYRPNVAVPSQHARVSEQERLPVRIVGIVLDADD